MTIIKNEVFDECLREILRYIANDSKSKAITFSNALFRKISNIPDFPYKYRRSIYHDNNNIRDFIYKGYTIPYLINNDKNQIVLLDIFKWSKR